MSGHTSRQVSHQDQGSGGHMGRRQHRFDVPDAPSASTRNWMDWLDRAVSSSRVRFGSERVGGSFSDGEEAALKKGLQFVAENFESGPETLQVSLAQVYAQGYLAGRSDEKVFGSPQSNINEGHV